MNRRAFLAGASSVALSSCASRPPPLPAPIAALPLHLSPLTDLVASAGLSWLVVVRLSEILRRSSLGAPIASIVPPPNVDRLAAELGFDPRIAEHVVVAGYPTSTLVLIDVAHDPEVVLQRFQDRLTSAIERATDGPNVTRISGKIGQEERALAVLEPSVVAMESGTSAPLLAAIAFAEGKLRRAKPALDAEPLATLTKRLGDAPIQVLAPAPGEKPWTKGAHGILARATAIGMSATPAPDGLHLRGLALGAWDDPPTGALHALQSTVQDVVGSPLGHLTGLREPIVPPSYGGDRDAIHFEAVIDPGKLADGLRAATVEGLSELFGAETSKKLRSDEKDLRTGNRPEGGPRKGQAATKPMAAQGDMTMSTSVGSFGSLNPYDVIAFIQEHAAEQAQSVGQEMKAAQDRSKLEKDLGALEGALANASANPNANAYKAAYDELVKFANAHPEYWQTGNLSGISLPDMAENLKAWQQGYNESISTTMKPNAQDPSTKFEDSYNVTLGAPDGKQFDSVGASKTIDAWKQVIDQMKTGIQGDDQISMLTLTQDANDLKNLYTEGSQVNAVLNQSMGTIIGNMKG